MGITCNYLVAPAILLNTPGLTREEFAEKLKEVHHSMDDIDLSKPSFALIGMAKATQIRISEIKIYVFIKSPKQKLIKIHNT